MSVALLNGSILFKNITASPINDNLNREERVQYAAPGMQSVIFSISSSFSLYFFSVTISSIQVRHHELHKGHYDFPSCMLPICHTGPYGWHVCAYLPSPPAYTTRPPVYNVHYHTKIPGSRAYMQPSVLSLRAFTVIFSINLVCFFFHSACLMQRYIRLHSVRNIPD